MAIPALARDFKEFLKSLNSNRVEYLLIGGYAVGIYGPIRATSDPRLVHAEKGMMISLARLRQIRRPVSGPRTWRTWRICECSLELQDCAQTFIDMTLQARWQCAGLFGEETAVERQELGNIHHRVAREARRARCQQNIAGCFGEFQVAGDHGHDCGLNTAAVEGVGLNHKHWPPVFRPGAAWFGKISPPNLSELNLILLYQESFSMDFNWARCNAESTFAGRREYTSFRRSVTAFPAADSGTLRSP